MRSPRADGEPIPFIYNPESGGGRGAMRFKRAEALLGLKSIPVDPRPTDAPRVATRLAREAAQAGHKTIIVMGGDGTLSEAANGVLQTDHKPELGFIPGGTGNDFLRDFDAPDIEHAIDRIALGTPRPIDAARVAWAEGTAFSINVFGTGFMALAGDRTNRQFKWMGHRGYTAAVLVEIARLKRSRTRVVVDDEELEQPLLMVAVCNSVHTGGAMKIAPLAKQDDGLLDVMILKDLNRRQLLHLFPKIFDGSHIRDDRVQMVRGRQVTIEPQDPSPLLVDGEVFGSTPVTVEVMPGALSVLL